MFKLDYVLWVISFTFVCYLYRHKILCQTGKQYSRGMLWINVDACYKMMSINKVQQCSPISRKREKREIHTHYLEGSQKQDDGTANKPQK